MDVVNTDKSGKRYKKRGRTTLADIWALNGDERIYCELDRNGVPCTDEAAPLGSFLGVIATNGKYAPLSFARWDDKALYPFKKKMLEIVEVTE